jgi:hypothetical protein
MMFFLAQRLQNRCYDMLLQLHDELTRIQIFRPALEKSQPRKLGAAPTEYIDETRHVIRPSRYDSA